MFVIQAQEGRTVERTMRMNLAGTMIAVGILLAIGLACSGTSDETEKANGLVNDGNAAVTDGKKSLNDATEKVTTMMGTDVKHLAEARTLANEAIRLYDQAADKCKAAASKYDEASKLKIDDKFKDYLAAKVKEYNKRAELVETLKSVPQALIDAQSKDAFTSRANAANQKAEAISKEADDLAAQADKIQKDNPSSFKK
jgi:hypothetical protein